MPTPADQLAQSLAKLKSSKRFSGSSNSYRKDNPAEYAKVVAYLDGGARPTDVVTDMGVHALLEEDVRRAIIVNAPSSSVLWSTSLETGDLSDWYSPQTGPVGDYGGGEFNDGAGDTIVTTAAARTGQYGMRQTAVAGTQATRMFRWRETRANMHTIHGAWYRIPFNIVVGAPGFFFNMAQFKSVDPLNPATNNFSAWVLGLKVRSSLNYLSLAEFNPDNGSFIADHDASVGVNLPVAGTWVWIEMEITQSSSTSGRITVRSGTDRSSLTTVLDVTNVKTKAVGYENQWSTNSYPGSGTLQNGSSTITLDVDDPEIRLG